jgi:hypothetical protein
MSLLPLPVPGAGLRYFSTEDSAQRAPLEAELGPQPVLSLFTVGRSE